MLLFPNGDKLFDGTTGTVLNGFNTTAVSGLPADVTLVAGLGATATFDGAAVGSGVGITYAGYTLGGASADQYVLASSCCDGAFRTTGTISAVAPLPSDGGSPPTSGTVDGQGGWIPGIAAPAIIALAVIGSGLNVPVAQLTETPAPAPVAEAPASTPQEVRNEQIRRANVPVVRPRKQARN